MKKAYKELFSFISMFIPFKELTYSIKLYYVFTTVIILKLINRNFILKISYGIF